MKRLFDIVFSLCGLVCLSWLFVIVAVLVWCGSKGGVFYRQKRVGRNNKDFSLYKFRSMRPASDSSQLITVGEHDSRVTKVGYFIRKYKIDELPQLINVLTGDMSIVGPRPEVRHYVDMYTEEQKRVLSVRPGITDPASIAFRNENALLEKAADPEQYYITEVMPEKLRMNLEYIDSRNFFTDIKIILRTVASI